MCHSPTLHVLSHPISMTTLYARTSPQVGSENWRPQEADSLPSQATWIDSTQFSETTRSQVCVSIGHPNVVVYTGNENKNQAKAKVF